MKLQNTIFYRQKANEASPFIQALNALIGEPLPVKTSYALAKIAKTVSDKQKAYEDARNALVKKYGEPAKDKNGKETGGTTVKEKNMEPFLKELNELIEMEEEYKIEKVTLEEKQLEGVKIKPQDLMVLEKIIDIK